jgi:hypothetical protein
MKVKGPYFGIFYRLIRQFRCFIASMERKKLHQLVITATLLSFPGRETAIGERDRRQSGGTLHDENWDGADA